MTLGLSGARRRLENIEIEEWNALNHRHVLSAIEAILSLIMVGQLWLYIGNSSSCIMQVHFLLRPHILTLG